MFVAVVAAGWYVASKLIPPYWDYLSLQDPVKEALVTAARGDEARARQSILQQGGELGLPLTEEDIQFSREGPMLAVRVSWMIPVDLLRYRYDLHFQIQQTTPLP
ncbi:MAG TPA: hypothetical protein VLT62_23125 [Candidatus Methylomirabilis sp.]|nr:hypothetical protein [Candidatus Methylomirabilis sp.]